MKPAYWLAVVGIVAALVYGCDQKRIGELNGRIAHLTAESKRVDTVYRRDTLTLTRVRRITDSVLVTDTVIRVDSVKVLIAAERQACDAVVKTCEQRVAIRDSIIRVLKKKPSVLSKLPWVLGGVVAGKLILK